VARLITRIRPSVSIWFHQPYGVVDESGGSVSIERRFARLIGMPRHRLPRYPGSASRSGAVQVIACTIRT
jgi:hypothetical protein